MILSVILGDAIDTPTWIEELRRVKADHIAVVDYEYTGEPEQIEDVLYLSPSDARIYMKKFDSVEFFRCFDKSRPCVQDDSVYSLKLHAKSVRAWNRNGFRP